MSPKKQTGFTLTEAMITVALVAIVVGLALPNYREYVIRTNRSEAIEALLSAAACQERLLMRNNAYDENACGGGTQNGLYVVTFTTSNGNLNFVATATPQDAQTDDSCGTLALTDTGVKAAEDEGGAFAQACWSGRFTSAGS